MALTLVTDLISTVFLTTSLLLHYLVYINQQEQFLDLSISILSTSAFKLAKSDFAAISDVSKPCFYQNRFCCVIR